MCSCHISVLFVIPPQVPRGSNGLSSWSPLIYFGHTSHFCASLRYSFLQQTQVMFRRYLCKKYMLDKNVDVYIDRDIDISAGHIVININEEVGVHANTDAKADVDKAAVDFAPGAILCVPDSKVHGANLGPIWGQQDPGGPHLGPMNFAIWGVIIMIIALWCQSSCVWHNALFLTTAKTLTPGLTLLMIFTYSRFGCGKPMIYKISWASIGCIIDYKWPIPGIKTLLVPYCKYLQI